MENKRDFFRIPLHGVKAKVLDMSIFRSYDGEIKDISGVGISFILAKEVFIDLDSPIKVTFTIEKETFVRKATILRKTLPDSENKLYACKFVENTEKDNATLSAVLLRLDAKRKK